MNIEYFGITWSATEYTYVLIILIGIVFSFLGVRFYRKKRVARLLSHTISKNLLNGFSLPRQYVRLVLMITGICCLALALLRPQWGEKEDVVTHEGRDLVIALDISRSMLATDCSPNRLLHAKEKIRTLVAALPYERIGLILFSGAAFVHCPLTVDTSSFNMFLDLVEVEAISSGTTAIDSSLKKALHMFKGGAERKSKLMVLFTDGEDFSHDLTGIKREAKENNLTVVTVGVGTESGAPVPLIDYAGNQKGHQMDEKGAVVISRLNESMLQNLSSDVGGIYVPPTHDHKDIATIVSYVDSFEKDSIEDKQMSNLHDQYPLFLLGSFVCFILEWLL